MFNIYQNWIVKMVNFELYETPRGKQASFHIEDVTCIIDLDLQRSEVTLDNDISFIISRNDACILRSQLIESVTTMDDSTIIFPDHLG